MKLNYDCVRDILLSLEDLIQYTDDLELNVTTLNNICTHSLMINYSKSDIAYSSQMMYDAGYIDICVISSDNAIAQILYNSITFAGHQYLDGIRSVNVWDVIKANAAKSAVSLTFGVISECAKSIAINSINL